MQCKNCEAAIDSKFCSNCGQKAEIHRLTFAHVFHEFIHAFTHADKGFVLLVKNLLWRPGFVAKEYLDGKRKKYFNPLSFIVITSAIHAFVALKTGYFASMGSSGNQGGGARRMPAIWVEVFQISNNNGKLLSLILIVPLLAFLSWIFFRRGRYLFSENLVLHAFIVGESHVIRTLIFIPLFLIFPNQSGINLWIFQTLLLAYLVVAYKQFFNQSIFVTIIKTIAIFVLFLILYWVVILSYVYIKHLLF
jgi:hypothetical protein